MSNLKIQSAIIMKGPGDAQVIHDLSIPSPDLGQLLIRTHSVALNPSDWMALDTCVRPGAGLGYDFSGEVVEIGQGVEAFWNTGDRVAGFVHGCHAANYSIGSFREYLTVDAELVIRLPDHISFNEASTLGMGLSTAGQALYQSLRLPLPEVNATTKTKTILIYGGSTATGSLAIQLAKLSGFRVITTCSEGNIPWVQSPGADKVVDYKSPQAIAQVRDPVRETGLSLILDCIGNEQTTKFCYQCFTALQEEEAEQPEYRYASLMPTSDSPPKVDSLPPGATILSKWNFVYTCFGKRFTIINDAFKIRQTWEASNEDKSFMISFYRIVEGLLAEDKIRVMPQEIKHGGLGSVLDGVCLVREGKVHAKKLVYLIM